MQIKMLLSKTSHSCKRERLFWLKTEINYYIHNGTAFWSAVWNDVLESKSGPRFINLFFEWEFWVKWKSIQMRKRGLLCLNLKSHWIRQSLIQFWAMKRSGEIPLKYQINFKMRPGVDFKNCFAPSPIFCPQCQTFTPVKSFSKIGRRAWTLQCRAQTSLWNRLQGCLLTS